MRDLFTKKLLTHVIPFVIIVCCLIPLIIYFVNSSSFEEKYAANQNTIESLKAELASLDRNATSDEAVYTSVEDQLYSASSIGTIVAQLQNKYRKFSSDSASYVEDVTANADAIRPYFKEGMDAQAVWFSTNQEYVWKFTTTYSINQSQIPCLFLCYKEEDDPNTLLAYVKATYDGNENKFITFEKNITAKGEKYLSNDVTPSRK